MIRVPTEVIKTRTQTSAYGEHTKSSFFAFRMTVAQEGIRGLYKGFGITVMREVLSCFKSLGSFRLTLTLDSIYFIAISIVRVLEAAIVSESRQANPPRP